MPRTLRIGDAGADVRALQDVLNFHIRRLAPIAVDGNFGPKTKARVIDFQRSNRLSDDGVAGPLTNNVLFESEKQQVWLSILLHRVVRHQAADADPAADAAGVPGAGRPAASRCPASR